MASKNIRALQLASLLGLASCRIAVGSTFRGVDPALKLQYDLQTPKFTCQSGKEIPVSRINDNYCDCIDGSDEPGTSACPNGHFYCRNRGHTPLLLNSSFVDDGYCDCCDGSDEVAGKCKNTCEEAGAENRAALKRKSSDFGAGLKQRRKYISQAGGQRTKWEQELKKTRAQEQQVQRQVNRLRGKKERVEKIEAKEREAAELKRKLQEDEEAANKVEPEASEVTDTDSGSRTSITDLQAEQLPNQASTESKPEASDASPETPQKSEAQVQQEIAEEYLAKARSEGNEAFREQAKRELIGDADPTPVAQDLTPEEEEAKRAADLEEEGRRIASQWTQDPEAAGGTEDDEETATVSDSGGDSPDASTAATGEDSDLVEESDTLPQDAQEAREGFFARLQSLLLPQSWLGDIETNEKSRQAVKDAYSAEDNKLSGLKGRASDLEGKLNQDFGPENVFQSLHDRCVSANVDKYTYEVCFFGGASQKDGGMSTSLGSFRQFEDGYTTMKYEGGQGCWNGPPRSIKVALVCGKKEELSQVEEPSRCEYRARMTTPAVCSESEYESVLQELNTIEEQAADKSEL